MSSIQSTLTLNDGMSATLLQINAALNTVIQSFQTLQTVSENAMNQQNRINPNLTSGVRDTGGLKEMATGALDNFVSLEGIQNVMNLTDELTQSKARLDAMNDGLQSTEQLQDKIFAAAQRSGSQYNMMADAVSKVGVMASDTFRSNDELIAFNEQLNKQLAISGTSSTDAPEIVQQLAQAMGDGVLKGEELNAVFEQAPGMIQAIASNLGVPVSQLMEMADNGEITAGVLRESLLSVADETNAKFESMPLTFAQIGNRIGNAAQNSFEPVLQGISEMVNSEEFNNLVTVAAGGIAFLGEAVLGVFEVLGSAAGFITENWSMIQPFIYAAAIALGIYTTALIVYSGVKAVATLRENLHAIAIAASQRGTFMATAAQRGFNAALLQSPVTWFVMALLLIIAAIYAIVAAYNKWTNSSVSATGIICGVFMTGLAFVGNLFVGLFNMVIGIFATFGNFVAAFVNFFANVFEDPVNSVARLFFDLVDTVLSLLETLAKAIDTIFGSKLASHVQGWRDDLGSWVDDKFGKGKEVMKVFDEETPYLKPFEYGDAYDFGYQIGESLETSVSGIFDDLFQNTTQKGTELLDPNSYMNQAGNYTDAGMGMSNSLGSIAEDTSAIKDSVSVSNEELTYLREIAEKEAVNRFTTAEVKIDMKNTNMINSDMDIDGVVNHLEDALGKAINNVKEGA